MSPVDLTMPQALPLGAGDVDAGRLEALRRLPHTESLLRIRYHRPELKNAKRVATPSPTLLSIEYGTAVFQADCQHDGPLGMVHSIGEALKPGPEPADTAVGDLPGRDRRGR